MMDSILDVLGEVAEGGLDLWGEYKKQAASKQTNGSIKKNIAPLNTESRNTESRNTGSKKVVGKRKSSDNKDIEQQKQVTNVEHKLEDKIQGTTTAVFNPADGIKNGMSGEQLQQGIILSEILGAPVCKKRRQNRIR